jgi:hypothetical protein
MTRAEKEAFKKRMAAGRKKVAKARGAQNPKKKAKAKAKANPNARKTKKVIGKGFGKQLAAEHIRAKKKAAKARKAPKHRRNQEPGSLEAAEQQFQRFHGKPPSRIVEYSQQFRYPEHFAELGRLVELRFFLNDANPDFALTGFGAAQVVSTPDGSNIYFLGGDQSIDLAAMDIASDKDFVELGPCTFISYHTIKGFHDFEPTTYWHEFGEEDAIYPGLVYDRLNKSLFLMSGNYRVRPEGIVN